MLGPLLAVRTVGEVLARPAVLGALLHFGITRMARWRSGKGWVCVEGGRLQMIENRNRPKKDIYIERRECCLKAGLGPTCTGWGAPTMTILGRCCKSGRCVILQGAPAPNEVTRQHVRAGLHSKPEKNEGGTFER